MASIARELEIVASEMLVFFFFNDTATTEIYPLSLHDALPISYRDRLDLHVLLDALLPALASEPAFLKPAERDLVRAGSRRSEEHTSELQSRPHLVCRLLLEKKNLPGRGISCNPLHEARKTGEM